MYTVIGNCSSSNSNSAAVKLFDPISFSVCRRRLILRKKSSSNRNVFVSRFRHLTWVASETHCTRGRLQAGTAQLGHAEGPLQQETCRYSHKQKRLPIRDGRESSQPRDIAIFNLLAHLG